MTKRVEFTIQRSTKDRRFYAHLEHGNGKTTLAEPRGRASLRSYALFCDSVWLSCCHQIDPGHVLQWPPTPFSKDSLLPRSRRLQ